MKEENATTDVPVTVTGTFNRPTLSLDFGGMVYEGRSVVGECSGNYTTVAGILTSLRLRTEGYEKLIPILLQESGR